MLGRSLLRKRGASAETHGFQRTHRSHQIGRLTDSLLVVGFRFLIVMCDADGVGRKGWASALLRSPMCSSAYSLAELPDHLLRLSGWLRQFERTRECMPTLVCLPNKLSYFFPV